MTQGSTYDVYQNWDEARKKLESFTVNCKHPDGRKYETIVVDSFTSAMDMTLRQISKTKGGDGKKIAGIPVSGIEDYNAESAVASELIALGEHGEAHHVLAVRCWARIASTWPWQRAWSADT